MKLRAKPVGDACMHVWGAQQQPPPPPPSPTLMHELEHGLALVGAT